MVAANLLRLDMKRIKNNNLLNFSFLSWKEVSVVYLMIVVDLFGKWIAWPVNMIDIIIAGLYLCDSTDVYRKKGRKADF